MPRPLLALSALLLGALPLSAQREPSSDAALFIGDSHVIRTAPGKGILYEAFPVIPIHLYGTTDGLFGRLLERHSTGRAFTVDLVPQYRVRQLDESTPSSPVRTPSFMPKVLIHWMRASRWRAPYRAGLFLDEFTVFVRSVQLTLGHYSNGQEGCFLASEHQDTLSKDRDCVPTLGLTADADTLNTTNGSFSTNYARLMWHGRWLKLDGNNSKRWARTLGLGVDLHSPWPGGGMSDQLASYYGHVRPFATAEHMTAHHWPCPPDGFWKKVAGRVTPCGYGLAKLWGEAEYIHVRPDNIPSIRFRARASYVFEKWKGFGWMMGIHRGQDYYNMGLARTFNVTEFGVVFDPERDVRVTQR